MSCPLFVSQCATIRHHAIGRRRRMRSRHSLFPTADALLLIYFGYYSRRDRYTVGANLSQLRNHRRSGEAAPRHDLMLSISLIIFWLAAATLGEVLADGAEVGKHGPPLPQTVLLIRHGEKPAHGDDLSKRGEERAACLAVRYGTSNISHLFAYTDHPSRRSVHCTENSHSDNPTPRSRHPTVSLLDFTVLTSSAINHLFTGRDHHAALKSTQCFHRHVRRSGRRLPSCG